MKHYLNILFAFLSLSFGLANASDLEREKKIADAIKEHIVIGEVAELKAGNTPFIALINDDTTEPVVGKIILLHGMGSNPNSPNLIQPLRDHLATHGWATAAIQLPILQQGASISDYMAVIEESKPRIESIIAHLEEQYPETPCVFVSHSLGTIMSALHLSEKDNLPCASATVFIGMPTLPSENEKLVVSTLLEKLALPVMDIYGSQDLDNVKLSAKSRHQAFQNNHPNNRQVEVTGADHSFSGLEPLLARHIHSWLHQIFQPSTLKESTP